MADIMTEKKNKQIVKKYNRKGLGLYDHWQTPPDLYEKLDKEFKFDFDPCPLMSTFNGLQRDWGERNFVNPPYQKKLKEAFVKKAIAESKKGKLCVCLLPVSTSSALFHDYIKPNAKEIRFIRGRVRFIGINLKGERVDNWMGMTDSMIVIFNGL